MSAVSEEAATLLAAKVHAWVTITDDGKPSLVGGLFKIDGRMEHVPLVAFGGVNIGKFRQIAQHHARSTGQPVWLVELAPTLVERLP